MKKMNLYTEHVNKFSYHNCELKIFYTHLTSFFNSNAYSKLFL